MVRRYGFTLIELIFAIIIIAISVLSLPMMNQAVQKGVDSNILQEAIFAASAELNEAVTAHWDDNSIEDPTKPNALARVIDSTLQNCDSNISSATFRLMQGHISQVKHRRCLDNNLTSVAIANVATVTSLSDMAHPLNWIFANRATEAKGYKGDYKSKLEVTRPADFNGNNVNIKKIESTVTDANDNVLIVLRAYSANIGEVDYYSEPY